MRTLAHSEPAAVVLSGDYSGDRAALVDFLDRAGDQVANLPARPDRTADQQQIAQAALTAGRRARRRFLEVHVERCYDELTDGGRLRLRLADLVTLAADRIPGLTPTRDQLYRERRVSQADKDGWEIDHAILCSALLASPRAGTHLMDTMRRPTAAACSALPGFRHSGHADLGLVRVARNGDVGEVTVDHRQVLNAEDDDLVAALEIAVDLVLLDDRIRVGVLRGAPMTHPRYAGRRVFSAGINLTALYQGGISLVEFFLDREAGYINKMCRGLSVDDDPNDWHTEPIEKPWIGVVDSFAIGGGAQLLLVLDHVVAEEGAYLTLPALREGIIPGLANLRLPQAAGERPSRQMIFGDRRIEADSDTGRLLVDEVTPADLIPQTVERAAAALANPAVIANRRIMHEHREPAGLLRTYLSRYAVEQARRLFSADLISALENGWIGRRR